MHHEEQKGLKEAFGSFSGGLMYTEMFTSTPLPKAKAQGANLKALSLPESEKRRSKDILQENIPVKQSEKNW